MNEKPKPKPPVKKQEAKPIEEPKKAFVRKPHLTNRPFQNHPGLSALKQSVETEKPRRGNRAKKGSGK